MAKVHYLQDDLSGRGPSRTIWGNCPILDILEDPNVGYFLHDDFIQFLEATHGWALGGTNQTCVIPATHVGGVVTLGATGADLDEGYLTTGNNEGGFCKIYTTAPKPLWFEARVQVSAILDQSIFVGLSEEALAAADTMADNTGVLASKDFVGFYVINAAPATVNCGYRKAGQAVVDIAAAVLTLVAGTWYKLGMRFDGTYLRYYVDGVPVVADPLKISTATQFPDGEELAVLFGVKTGEGVAKTLLIDWVRVAQLA